MSTRRDFFGVSLGTAVSLAVGRQASAAFDAPTWMTYAVNVEMFWNKLPFLEHLKKVAEAGFSHFEFWAFKTKDVLAMIRRTRHLI